jgi:hypothetical protein
MPNQRDPNKERLKTWMQRKDVKLLRDIADENGVFLGDLLSEFARAMRRNPDLLKHRARN